MAHNTSSRAGTHLHLPHRTNSQPTTRISHPVASQGPSPEPRNPATRAHLAARSTQPSRAHLTARSTQPSRTAHRIAQPTLQPSQPRSPASPAAQPHRPSDCPAHPLTRPASPATQLSPATQPSPPAQQLSPAELRRPAAPLSSTQTSAHPERPTASLSPAAQPPRLPHTHPTSSSSVRSGQRVNRATSRFGACNR
jgi:hypothetical protein